MGVTTLALALNAGFYTASSSANDKPLTEKWAPSEWGKDDKAGAVNRTTSAMVLSAVKLVKLGKVAP